VEIQASAPIVPFRETALKAQGRTHLNWLRRDNDTDLDMAPTKTPNASRGTIKGSSSHQVVSFTIRASPIPTPILDFILANLGVWKTLLHNRAVQQGNAAEEDQVADGQGDVVRKPTITPQQFWDVFAEKCKEAGGEWANVSEKTWAFGPQKAGACLLIDSRHPNPYTSWVCLLFSPSPID
jgi:ribosome assembly protein 1